MQDVKSCDIFLTSEQTDASVPKWGPGRENGDQWLKIILTDSVAGFLLSFLKIWLFISWACDVSVLGFWFCWSLLWPSLCGRDLQPL